MTDQAPHPRAEPGLLPHGWAGVIAMQVVVALMTLLLYPVHALLTVAATVVNVGAIVNTVRVGRTRVRRSLHGPAPGAGAQLASVSLSVGVSAVAALALVVWPR